LEDLTLLVSTVSDKNSDAEKGLDDQNAADILVVDDEKGIRDSIREAVQYAGYSCWTAGSGEEALKFLQEKHVDILIADIRMPGLNGFELTGVVKEKYDTDVIIITGYGKDFQYEEAIKKGASEFILKPIRLQELIVRLKRVLRERTLIAQRRQMEEQLREMTITDDLTKLYNMRHFYEQLQLEMDRTLRYKHSLSLLLLDVDRFKQYNDTHGHLEGDKVLIRLSEVIRECLRKSDSAYRYGGDEFIVILPYTQGKEAKKVAERITAMFPGMDIGHIPDGSVVTTLSVGVVEYEEGEELSRLVSRADQAMYTAKKQGGNRSLLAGK
jgi:diguanylate cyclase (GGDEF)-like protein